MGNKKLCFEAFRSDKIATHKHNMKKKIILRQVHRDRKDIMVGRIYERLVYNIVKSLKLAFGKKPFKKSITLY